MSKKETFTTTKAVLVNEQYPGHILILQRNSGSDIPGGKKNPHETLEEGLQREIGEEIGNVKLHDIQWLAKQAKRIGKHALHEYHVFAARVELPENGLELSDEHQGYRWVPLCEFKHLDIHQRYKEAVKLGETIIRSLIPELIAHEQSVYELGFEPSIDYSVLWESQEQDTKTARP